MSPHAYSEDQVVEQPVLVVRGVWLESRLPNLRRTRDLLLPRLLSGQIDVDDFEVETGEDQMEVGA